MIKTKGRVTPTAFRERGFGGRLEDLPRNNLEIFNIIIRNSGLLGPGCLKALKLPKPKKLTFGEVLSQLSPLSTFTGQLPLPGLTFELVVSPFPLVPLLALTRLLLSLWPNPELV